MIKHSGISSSSQLFRETSPRLPSLSRSLNIRAQSAASDEANAPLTPPPQQTSGGGEGGGGGAGLAAGAAAVAVAAFAMGRLLTGDVTLSTLARESVPLETALVNGKPSVIEFYADWCEVCKGLVAEEIKVERKYKDDVNFVMLNIDNSKWQQEMDEYHVGGVPHFVFMDSKANPMAAAVGKIPMEILDSNIQAMSKGKPLPYLAPASQETSEVDPQGQGGRMTKAMASRSAVSPRDHSAAAPTATSSSVGSGGGGGGGGADRAVLESSLQVADQASSRFYDFRVKDIDGKDFQLDSFRGKVVLVVNLASACGFTPQYKELEALYEKLGPKGFVVAGFPCNQFGAQESGSNEEIKSFAQRKYGVSFPLFSKVDVNGPGADPLFDYLKAQKGGEDVRWNFSKFLVDKEGKVVSRYPSTTSPFQIESDIEKLIKM